MAELLDLKEGQNVLEIGTGCGYSAAITLELISTEGMLTSIERIPELHYIADENLKSHFRNKKVRYKLIIGDGSGGYLPNAPYDRIYFTAEVDTLKICIDYIASQLKPEGLILFPSNKGQLTLQNYIDNKLVEELYHGNVTFVPLVIG